jgi:putative nucleotidyltransferase with HDIG domain
VLSKVFCGGALTFAGAMVGAAASIGLGDWDLLLFAVLLTLVVGTDLVDIEVRHMHVSGSFLGLVLAMALLGPAQAAAIGVLATLVDSARKRPRPAMAAWNLAAWAAFPLCGGLVLHVLAGQLGAGVRDAEYALALLPAFAVATLVNFGLVGWAVSRLDGVSLKRQFRTVFVPLLPSEAAMALVGCIVVYAYGHIGGMALAMLTALLFAYLWLLRALLISEDRAELLDKRTRKLAALQVGVLTAMLQTLALRDKMTARHSAAVARYAREIARAAGCTTEEQELVHTAGLLHDIGKFIFPDSILLSESAPSAEDWEIIRRHPAQGAKVVRRIDGYGPVADIILAHHERVDGRGYPRGIAGEAIPRLARIISIADTYDVLTARDSYRKPLSPEAALAELRRVSGSQLDGELVEHFARVLEHSAGFGHGDDADFEAELRFERRVRQHAAGIAPAASGA